MHLQIYFPCFTVELENLKEHMTEKCECVFASVYLQATNGSLQLLIARNKDFSNLAHKLLFKDSPCNASFIMQNIYVSWFLKWFHRQTI